MNCSEIVICRTQELLREKGLKKKYLFEKIGKTPVLFNDWKLGKSKPTEQVLLAIAEVLDTTPEYLRGETDKKEKPAEDGELSQMEKEMLRRLTALSPEMQEKAMEFLALLQDAQDKQGK